MSRPNPGFDFNSFDSAFDISSPTGSDSDPSGIDRERVSEEWYTCQRCGGWYPRSRMLNQNGLNLCTGSATRNCVDLPGHAAATLQLDVPYEERPEPLPNQDEDL